MGATVEEGVIWVLATEGEKVVLSYGAQLLLFTPCHSFYGRGVVVILWHLFSVIDTYLQCSVCLQPVVHNQSKFTEQN